MSRLHWLEARLDGLATVLAEAPRTAQPALETLVGDIARHEGVYVAFAARDGLLAARAGAEEIDCEGLAALGATVAESARAVAPRLALGPLTQVVLAGPKGKLALLEVRDVLVGVLAPHDVRLGDLLAKSPPPRSAPSAVN